MIMKQTNTESREKNESTDSKDGPRAWIICFAFFITAMLNYGTARVLGIFLDEWEKEFKVPKSIASFIPSAAFLAMGLGFLAMALFHGSHSPRGVSIVSGVVASGAFVGVAFADSFALLLICTIVGFVASTTSYTSAIATLGSWTDRCRPLAFGLSNAGSPIAGMAFPPILAALTAELGWRGCFLIVAGLTMHHCLCGMMIKPFPGADEAMEGCAAKDLWRRREFILVLTSTAIRFGADVVVIVYQPTWGRMRGLDEGEVATLVLCLGGGDLLARLLVGPILTIPTARQRTLPALVVTHFLAGVGAVVVGMSRDYGQLAMASVLFGVSYGAWLVTFTSFLSDYYASNFSFAYNISMFIGGITSILFPFTLGHLQEHYEYFELVFFISSGLLALSGFLLMLLLVPPRLSSHLRT